METKKKKRRKLSIVRIASKTSGTELYIKIFLKTNKQYPNRILTIRLEINRDPVYYDIM